MLELFILWCLENRDNHSLFLRGSIKKQVKDKFPHCLVFSEGPDNLFLRTSGSKRLWLLEVDSSMMRYLEPLGFA